MLLWGSLFMGLKWMQWTGVPSSTFGQICEIKGYLHLVDSFWFKAQEYTFITYIVIFLEYCVIHS